MHRNHRCLMRKISTFLFELGHGYVKIGTGARVIGILVESAKQLRLTLVEHKAAFVLFWGKHVFHTRNILNRLVSDHESFR